MSAEELLAEIKNICGENPRVDLVSSSGVFRVSLNKHVHTDEDKNKSDIFNHFTQLYAHAFTIEEAAGEILNLVKRYKVFHGYCSPNCPENKQDPALDLTI